MRVLVLHSRVPPMAGADDQDTLVQAGAVAEALCSLGHEVFAAAADADASEWLPLVRRARIDVVFNLAETLLGSAGPAAFVPLALAARGVPCTGSDGIALAASTNKRFAKNLLCANGVDTPAGLDAHGARWGEFAPGRYIIKSVTEHASHGLEADNVVYASSEGELLAAVLRKGRAAAGEWLAEGYVEGREFNVSLLRQGQETKVLPPAEMTFIGYGDEEPKIVGYRAKWEDASREALSTVRRFDLPDSDGPLVARVARCASSAFTCLGLCGYGRVDIRVDQTGRPWVIDVNANPCISPDSGFAAALARAGMGYEEGVQAILTAALPGDGKA